MATQYDDMQSKAIDNDFHPSDKGLSASQDDHWGTKLAGDIVAHPIMNNPSAASNALMNQTKSGRFGSNPGDASDRTNITPLKIKKK